MDEKQIVSLIEKAVGDSLNEEKIKGLLSGEIKAQLEALPAGSVHVGDDGPEQKAPATFSQFLGDVKRAAIGHQAKFVGDKGLVKAESGINEEQLAMVAPEMIKSAYGGLGSAGGYLIPTEEAREILNLVNKYSAVRALCREIPMKTRMIVFPTLTGGLTAYWVPETSSDQDQVNPEDFAQADGFKPPSAATFGQLTITAHTLAVKVAVSNQLLDDADPAVDSVLMSLFAETLGAAFDIASLRGAGTTLDPVTGLANKITTNVLAAGADFDFDDIADLIFAPRDYAPSATELPILGHPKAEKMLLKVKDADGQYIYRQPTDSADVPRVWGEQFVRDPNILTNLGAGTNETRLFAGDFRNSAFVGNRLAVIIKTNPWAEPYFSFNQTAFLAEMRIGFNVSDERRFAVMNGVPTN